MTRRGGAHVSNTGANILIHHTGVVKLADFGCSKLMDRFGTPPSDGLDMDTSFKRIRGTIPFMAPEGWSSVLQLCVRCTSEPSSSDPLARLICRCLLARLCLWDSFLYALLRAVIRQIGHGRKADVWSVGCVVIEMATGGVPWSEFSNKVCSCAGCRLLLPPSAWRVFLWLFFCCGVAVGHGLREASLSYPPSAAPVHAPQLATMFHVATTGQHPHIPDHLSDDCRGFLGRCFAKDPKERASVKELLRHPWIVEVAAPGTDSAIDVLSLHHS
jgi:serine/threonine protein kinase